MPGLDPGISGKTSPLAAVSFGLRFSGLRSAPPENDAQAKFRQWLLAQALPAARPPLSS